MTKNYFHICNPNTPEKSGVKNIYTLKELQEIQEDAHTVYLIHVHLNWNENKLSNNYGFDIANLIRTEQKSKAPIIFYSPIQVEYFEQKSDKEIKYKILFGRGSAFLEAPFKKEDLSKLAESIESLSDAALHDVATMLCNLKGIVIDKLNHDLKFGIPDIDKVVGSVAPYLSALQKQLIGLDKFVSDIKAAKNSDEFDTIKRQFILLCNDRLTEKGKDNSQEINAKPHTILLLDDLQEEINKAKENLKEQFNIVETTTGRQAIDILKKDVDNKIVAVIADWRLFADTKQTYWQSLQGYEVLDFAAKNGIRSLFALTSQADFVVHHLRNLMGIRFSMFKKENLNTADQWKIFADVLFEACEETVNARASILDVFPKWNAEWKRKGINQPTLKEQYITYWNSVDRDSITNEVEKTAEHILNLLCNEEETSLLGQGDLAQYGFSNKVLELKKTLILRRIWFALWFKYLPNGKFSVSTHSKSVYEQMIGAAADGSISQKIFTLCIQQDKISEAYMLPEEIEWLKRKKLL